MEKNNFSKDRRRLSDFIRLREFHNEIKSNLLKYAAKHSPSERRYIFDISCGKGGDIHKWKGIESNFVLGIDPDENSIVEAKHRLERSSMRGKVVFQVAKISDENLTVFAPEKYFDIVSCQFTLHYFSPDEELERVIGRVSRCLKPGGMFVGTSPDGGRIMEILEGSRYVDERFLRLDAEVDSKGIPLRYFFNLIDTHQIYTSEIPEYFVDREKFIEVCSRHSLRAIHVNDFMGFYEPGYHKLLPYEKQITELYFAFIFIKTE